jgi:putative oxidoreductase
VRSLWLPPEAAFVAATLEIGGAIAILLRDLMRIKAALFIVLMTCTTLVVKLSRGFVGGYEVDIILLTIVVSLLITGPGRLSIEWHVLKRGLFPNGRKLVPADIQI